MGFAIFGAYPICFAAARDALFELKPSPSPSPSPTLTLTFNPHPHNQPEP